MRVAMLLVLLCAGSAGADPIRLFSAGYLRAQPDDGAPFLDTTIAYDGVASFAMVPGEWAPDASSGIAAFVTKLTNGVDESLTMSSSGFSTNFMESGKVNQEYLPGANDLHGTTISYLKVARAWAGVSGVQYQVYSLQAWGHLPEPSAGVLLLVLCGCLAHVRTGARSRLICR